MVERLEALGLAWLEPLVRLTGSPARCVTNLERWIEATSNPRTQCESLLDAGPHSIYLLNLLGASDQLSDTLIQNPDLAHLVLDEETLRKPLQVDAIVAEGRRSLSVANSPSHRLDRIRLLKQMWTVRIAAADLGGLIGQEEVWLRISQLADAVICLTCEVVWADFCTEKDLLLVNPVSIVAFGKLGGSELNYSSDVDLVFVVPDDISAKNEAHVSRFCERLSRAMSDQMGRGHLYRVDLRLRPFGSRGPIVAKFSALEQYYVNDAALWEILALIRARMIVGIEQERFDELRIGTAFQPNRIDFSIDELLLMRSELEALTGRDDIKRGPGGIRDVEFLVQILQLIFGATMPELQQRSTLAVLRAIQAEKSFDLETCVLAESYEFLRKLEHRLQLIGGLQTHELPAEEESLQVIARLLAIETVGQFTGKLEATRRAVRRIYSATLGEFQSGSGPKEDEISPLVKEFLNLSQAPSQYELAVKDNSDIAVLIEQITEFCPSISAEIAGNPVLIEAVFSGDIFADGKIEFVGPDYLLSKYCRVQVVSALVRNALDRTDPSSDLSKIAEMALGRIFEPFSRELDLLVVGSLAGYEFTGTSDCDVIILAKQGAEQSDSEVAVQRFLKSWEEFRRGGYRVSLDVRLRPEGKKGLLAPSRAAISLYAKDGMETWERFALGRARVLVGDAELKAFLRQIVYQEPLDANANAELKEMKLRMERERLTPLEFERNLKLGSGGLEDLQWILQLAFLKNPDLGFDSPNGTLARIEYLGEAGLIESAGKELLSQALKYLRSARNSIYLLGFEPDMLPEIPAKLDLLASHLGFTSGDELKSADRLYRSGVRDLLRLIWDNESLTAL
ncbi:MAG: hypothetical protein K8R88_00215 [Armatimonadetes bacterium]|nr:hypothetical protein [Armatimonadota bacterium]